MTKQEWEKQMEKIGITLASTWGARYESCELLENGNVRFYMDEFGDKFYTDLGPDELEMYIY